LSPTFLITLPFLGLFGPSLFVDFPLFLIFQAPFFITLSLQVLLASAHVLLFLPLLLFSFYSFLLLSSFSVAVIFFTPLWTIVPSGIHIFVTGPAPVLLATSAKVIRTTVVVVLTPAFAGSFIVLRRTDPPEISGLVVATLPAAIAAVAAVPSLVALPVSISRSIAHVAIRSVPVALSPAIPPSLTGITGLTGIARDPGIALPEEVSRPVGPVLPLPIFPLVATILVTS